MVEGLGASAPTREPRPRRPAPAPGAAARLAARRRFPLLSANIVDTAGRSPSRAGSSRRRPAPRRHLRGHRDPAPGARRCRGATSPCGTRSRPPAARRRTAPHLPPRGRLSQLGLEEDARLAREVPGIDVILGGFTRDHAVAARRGRDADRARRRQGDAARPARARGRNRRGEAWIARPTRRAVRRSLRLEHRAARRRHPRHPAVAALLERHREELRARNLAEQEAAPQPPPPRGNALRRRAGLRRLPPGTAAPVVGQRARARHGGARPQAPGVEPGVRPVPRHGLRRTAAATGSGRSQAVVDMGNVQCEACHGFGREHRGKGKIRGRVAEADLPPLPQHRKQPDLQVRALPRLLGDHTERYFTRKKTPAPPGALR